MTLEATRRKVSMEKEAEARRKKRQHIFFSVYHEGGRWEKWKWGAPILGVRIWKWRIIYDSIVRKYGHWPFRIRR